MNGLTSWVFTKVPLFELEGQLAYVRVRNERSVCEKGAASSRVEQRDARKVGARLGEIETYRAVDPRDGREHAGDNDVRLSTVRGSIRA